MGYKPEDDTRCHHVVSARIDNALFSLIEADCAKQRGWSYSEAIKYRLQDYYKQALGDVQKETKS